ncbi:aminotransferase class V-fold PLP-dependent enzyme [Vagococcus vulneris]|uniref:Aminotransferase class V domain-containing protein n=1 Tax=Vagococcus vulneris TaxID=1977869 RepID=A0A429ZXJ9_9ENTE|nr:aminotransferase class V-fold PLP-dependent enzyme [Vagococcus vulneris]RST98592.1 hypothetical protein CBF37_07395 [Vagococcus vulneris]
MTAVYFDNAATTVQKPVEVAERVYQTIQSQQFGNPARGSHDFSLNSFREVEKVRNLVKELVHSPETYEVVFAANATTALNMAIKGTILRGQKIVTTTWEHNAVLRPVYQVVKERSAEVEFISSTPISGDLNYEEFERTIKQMKPDVVIVNHGSNVTGNILDLTRIKFWKQQYGFLLIVDASQTMGQVSIDLSDGLIDILCFTGHKSLYGPTGTGGLCVRKELMIEPLITGGDGIQSFSMVQPQTYPILLEAGTMNVAGISGLGAGLEYILEKTPARIQLGLQQLRDAFLSGLSNNNNIVLYQNDDLVHTGVVSFNLVGIDSAEVSNYLWEHHQIATRPGYHCAPKMHEVLGTKKTGTVRCSFSNFNTYEEIEHVTQIINELSRK